jgi:uncharacterized membrane protein YkoI
MLNLLYKVAAITITLGFLSAHALADIKNPQVIDAMVQQYGLISLEQAKTKALTVKPGFVKEVELENKKYGKGWDYEVEILDADGVEWEVDIDAKTGEVISIKID